MSRSFTFLVNPASGGGSGAHAVAPVVRACQARGAQVRVETSPGPTLVAPLVRDAVARGDVVVSAGGDGMLSHVIGPVVEAGATLGIVPVGRGNDFARMLAFPVEPDPIAEALLERPVRTTDAVRWSLGPLSSVIAGSVYCGLDARAAAMVHGMKRMPGPLQYPAAALRAIATYRPSTFRIDVDGEVTARLGGMVVVANSAYYGKGMKVAPDASVHDGLLEVVVVAAASRTTMVRAFPSIYSGAHLDRPEVTVLRGRRIELSADPAVAVGADGEPLPDLPGLDAAPMVIEALPDAVRVIGG